MAIPVSAATNKLNIKSFTHTKLSLDETIDGVDHQRYITDPVGSLGGEWQTTYASGNSCRLTGGILTGTSLVTIFDADGTLTSASWATEPTVSAGSLPSDWDAVEINSIQLKVTMTGTTSLGYFGLLVASTDVILARMGNNESIGIPLDYTTGVAGFDPERLKIQQNVYGAGTNYSTWDIIVVGA